LRARIASETGHDSRAGAVASEFRVRRPVWSGAAGTGLIELETERFLLDYERSTLRPMVFEGNLEAWSRLVEDSGRIQGPWADGWVWALESALDATTANKAKEALAAAPTAVIEGEPILRSFPSSFSSYSLLLGVIGRTFALAGQVDDGLRYLRAAANQCMVLDDAFGHTWARFWLGQALEQNDDREGACAAYEVVVDRWGKAQPRSVTAEAAAGRMRALGCGR
jgi:serine/threonine-protein kinase